MNIKKMYFGLVSLISLIALSVSLGVSLTALGKIYFISDSEYLAVHNYELDNCNYTVKNDLCGPNYKNTCNYDKKEYQNLVSKCREETKKKLLLKRYYYLKISLISSLATFIVFVLLFVFHYFKFKKFD